LSPSSSAPLVVVGDALLDRDLEGTVERLSPEAPVLVVDDPVERSRPGGAALAAALAARDGERPVLLVTALARDARGAEVSELLRAAGVGVVELVLEGETPEKARVRGAGQTLLRLDRGGREPSRVSAPSEALAAARDAVSRAAAVLVSDYGRGVAAVPELRDELAALPAHAPVVWDPHPRGAEPVAGCLLATPNAGEAAGFAGARTDEADDGDGDGFEAAARHGAELARRWKATYVSVTRGAHGALLAAAEGAPLVVPGPAAAIAGDPCGAGDRFASRAALRLARGALPSAAVAEAVAEASRFVAEGGAARETSDLECERRRGGVVGAEPALALAEQVRARGGRVVATGGCFDLLHAGHISSLRAARALGDCLVVLLNSDASVRRLKGADRPLVDERDRAAVLSALDAVDAVIVFDEDTPAQALERLRPGVFAKGGDYAGRDLPEAEVLKRHGGQVVVLPYMAGRSTTRLIEEVALRGGR